MEGKDQLFQGTADCELKAVAANAKCQCSDEEENQAHSQESKKNNLPVRNKFIEKIFGTVDCGSKPSTIIGCHKDEKQEPTQEKEANMLRSVLSLVHDSQCNNNCYFSQCRKMKIIMLHTKKCKIVNCPICKRVNEWSDYHSKDCQETKCPVPFCLVRKNFEQIKCDNVQGSSRKAVIQKCVRSVERASKSTDADCQKQTNPTEWRKLAIQRCILSLEHACQCKDDNCRLPSCQKMKRIVSHAKTCKRKGNGSCAICKQLIVLNRYHAKNCQETKCPVPLCLNIKYKLKQQRMAQNQILKRRIATTQNRGMMETKRQSSPGSSNQSNQPSPDNKPLTSPHGPQPGIGMKPSACPPVAALQAVQQVQAAAARQTVPHMVASTRPTVPHMVGPGSYGNNTMVNHPTANPALMHAQQQRMQKPMPQMLPGQQNRMMGMRNMGNWDNSNFNQNMQPQGAPQPGQPMGLRPPSQMMGANNMPNPAGPAPGLSQV